MSPEDPRHGQYAGWQAHRKDREKPCGPCRDAQAVYHKRMRYNLHANGPSRIELGDDAWRVIDSMGRRELARLTGLRDSFLSRLHKSGPTTKVYRRTRDAILTARPDATPLGVQRRLRALFALGYSGAALAREVGISKDAMLLLLTSEKPRRYHHARTTDAVVEVYERLSGSPMPTGSPAVATRNRAQKRGWLPPLAWDDIDDPNETPVGKVRQIGAGRPPRIHALIEDFDFLVSCGESEQTAAARLGIARLDSFKDQRRRVERESEVA